MDNKYTQLNLFENQDLQPINFTRISIFLRCPKEYWYRYKSKDKKYSPQGQKIFEGRLLHKAAEEYLNLPFQARESQRIINKLSSESNLFKIIENKNLMMTAIRLFDHSFLNNLNNVQVEIPFKLNVGNFLFKGRADCLAKDDYGWILFDFKRDESELEHIQKPIDKYLQLIFYSIGLEIEKTIGLTTVRIGHYFFLNGKNDTVNLTGNLIKEGLNRISEIASEIESTSTFPAKLNNLCGSCMVGAKGACTEFNTVKKDLWST